MPEFDIRVLSVGVAVSSILLVVALRLLSHVAADVPAIRAWSQGGVHWLLGFALLGLRGHVPDFVSVVVALYRSPCSPVSTFNVACVPTIWLVGVTSGG